MSNTVMTGIALLSRDARRYRTWFSTLDLIAPHGA